MQRSCVNDGDLVMLVSKASSSSKSIILSTMSICLGFSTCSTQLVNCNKVRSIRYFFLSASTIDSGFNPDSSTVNPSIFQQHIRNDSNVMAQLFQNDPELAQAILGNDLNKLQDVLRLRNHQRAKLQRRQNEEMGTSFDIVAHKEVGSTDREGHTSNW